MMRIDASTGEGGGQLVRTAVALSALTGTPVELVNVRARRAKPGLAAQHLTAVQAVAALCEARTEGLALHAQAFRFTPGPLRGGTFAFDVGTAGSVTLVLQALLPILLMAPAPTHVRIIGGTDVRAAPPVDYWHRVMGAFLSRAGLDVSSTLERRGYFPRGGGAVTVAVHPGRPRPVRLAGSLGRPPAMVEGTIHVCEIAPEVAARMRAAALHALGDLPSRLETLVLGPGEASGQGGAIVLWALGPDAVLGAARVAERGVRAETLGGEAGAELAADVAAGAGLDGHMADQVLIYLALAGGGGFRARALSSHARTAIWLIERLLPVRFEISEAGGLVRVEVHAR